MSLTIDWISKVLIRYNTHSLSLIMFDAPVLRSQMMSITHHTIESGSGTPVATHSMVALVPITFIPEMKYSYFWCYTWNPDVLWHGTIYFHACMCNNCMPRFVFYTLSMGVAIKTKVSLSVCMFVCESVCQSVCTLSTRVALSMCMFVRKSVCL